MATPKLKLGNDKWATKSKSLLAYNDEGNNFKSLPFQVERLSGGSYKGRNGLIQYAASEEPRIDFTKNTKGALLLEPQRTNYATYSSDASQWGNVSGSQSITKTQNYSTAPDGTQTATRLQATATGSNYSLINLSTFSITGNYAGSVYLKSNTGNTENVIVYGRNTPVSSYAIGNQWQRIEIQGSATSGQNSYLFLGSFPNNGSDESIDILVWGGQLEAGDYSTSYIPTADSTATRIKDEVYNGGNKYIFNLTEGTFFIDVNPFIPSANTNIGISNGTDSQKIVFIFQSYGTQVRTFSSGGVSEFDNLTFNQRNKIAVSFKTNEYKIFINGTKVGTDTSASVPTGMDRLNFSNRTNTASYFEGEIYQTQIYNEVLTDAELQTLTTL